MYEDRTQNYDPEIHEEYLIHDTPFLLPYHYSHVIIIIIIILFVSDTMVHSYIQKHTDTHRQ